MYGNRLEEESESENESRPPLPLLPYTLALCIKGPYGPHGGYKLFLKLFRYSAILVTITRYQPGASMGGHLSVVYVILVSSSIQD